MKAKQAVFKKAISNVDAALEEFCLSEVFQKNGQKEDVEVWAFIGPSGVGKSFAAKKIASMTGKPENIVTYCVANMGQDILASVLIGMPPGYRDYSAKGTLVDMLRKNPETTVIFDEIEKASERVLKVIREAIYTAVITDAAKNEVPIKGAKIFMTGTLKKEKLIELLSDKDNTFAGNIVEIDGPNLWAMHSNQVPSVSDQNGNGWKIKKYSLGNKPI